MSLKKEPIHWNKTTDCGKTPRALLVYLMAFFALAIFPADSYLPSIPFIQKHFGMLESTVQSTVTVFLFAMAVGSLIFGPVAHHIGRKPTLLLAGSSFLLGSFLCLWAPSSTYFLLGRLVQGLGATGFMTLGRTIIRDVFSGGQVVAISSYTIPTVSVAIAVAPMIGGYLQESFDWPGTFWFSIITYAIVILFVFFDFPETKPKAHTQDIGYLNAYLTLIQDRSFICFTTSTGLAMGFIMAYQTMAPLLYQTILGLSPVEFGWLGLISCISMSIAAWINHHALDRLGSDNLLILGTSLLFIAGLATFIPGSFGTMSTAWLLIPFMVGLCGATLTFTNAFSRAMNPWPHLASFAAAIYNTWQYAVAALASLVAAFIPESNQVPMGIIWLILAALQGVVIYLAITTKEH